MVKSIGVVLPCRNEQDNIRPLVDEIEQVFSEHLPEYEYTIQFMDNCSTDSTRDVLRSLIAEDNHVRAIFNVANFTNSAFHGILQASGDCLIYMASDFQDPPSLIPEFVSKWEDGAKIVCGIKAASAEKTSKWRTRSLYYSLVKHMSDIDQIEHFTGFALYDREFVEVIRSLNDTTPTLRGIVAEYGYAVDKVEFEQPLRRAGKSSQSFISLFDYAMKNITSYTRRGVHYVCIAGAAMSVVSFAVGIVSLVFCAVEGWSGFWPTALIAAEIAFFGSVIIFVVGYVGEYVLSINTRAMKKPFAIERERIGFPNAPIMDARLGVFHPSEKAYRSGDDERRTNLED